MAILQRTERAMVRAMCGAKMMEKKRTEDLMEMLGLKETVVQMAKANRVRWYGHVLRRDDGQAGRKALEFEVKDDRGRHGKCKWRRRAGGCIESSEIESGSWSWRDCCQSGVNPATLVYGDKPGSKLELTQVIKVFFCEWRIHDHWNGCGGVKRETIANHII